MRVFLRSKRTKLYRTESDGWTAGTAQALGFTSIGQAARFAFDENVLEAEIIVRCDVVEQEVALPLLPEWCAV